MKKKTQLIKKKKLTQTFCLAIIISLEKKHVSSRILPKKSYQSINTQPTITHHPDPCLTGVFDELRGHLRKIPQRPFGCGLHRPRGRLHRAFFRRRRPLATLGAAATTHGDTTRPFISRGRWVVQGDDVKC